MAAITNLYSTYAYPAGKTSLPIVAVMHGYAASAYSTTDVLNRMARYHAFVISPGMRGRNGADGTRDASGREIYDIHDAIEYVKTTYPSIVDSDHICVVGYSGGGGNALAFASKFPDYANVIVSHFGMSDYGYADADAGLDDAWGWWSGSGSQPEAELGTPAAAPNKYRARNAQEAIGNFTGGHLYLFHDADDANVPVIQSQRVTTVMTAAGLSNYTLNVTTAIDDPRWLHGNPVIGDNGEPCIQTEPIWLQAVVDKTYPAWTIAASGTVTVIGYIKTKRFTIWLNANGTATTGIDAAATVAYNTATDAYTVTPLTGALDVTITQGAKSGSATNITEATLITVAA